MALDFSKLEADAKLSASKHVANLLQRPDQLEKIDQLQKRVARKKVSLEAMLKTALQTQLDSVKTGLNQLQMCLQDVREIKSNLGKIDECFKDLPDLLKRLQDVKEENCRHSQYSTAMENLQHIFLVPDSVIKAQKWISEGKLLHAHQYLSDLENSRDDLLCELHRFPNQNASDKALLKAYFLDVESLSDTLAKQLWLSMQRVLNSVRKEPATVVTALRIIEREEKADVAALQKQKETGFLAPGRPKAWREKAMEVLSKSVFERIEGNQFEDRKDNKMWLVRHLEVTRQLINEDLKIVRTMCVPCFPPHYDIFNKFIHMYHISLSQHLKEVIQSGLEGNEHVSLLSWAMNTYLGQELMGSPELGVNGEELPPLLDAEDVDRLFKHHIKMMERNYISWMRKTVSSEFEDWNKDIIPETDSHGHFRTTAPVIVFQMVDENLQVSSTISQDLVFKALVVSIEQVTRYGSMYKDSIVAFKNKYFEDRSKIPYFTHYMIAIANNCLHFLEFAKQMRQNYWKPNLHDNDVGKKYEMLLSTFQNLRDDVAQYLLEEAFFDLEPQFQDLITKKWQQSVIPVDTICVTLEDYFQDYIHLHPKNFEIVITEAQNRVAKRYITAMLQKKLTLKVMEDRKYAVAKMKKEANQIKAFFMRIASSVLQMDSPFNAIESLTEVIMIEDQEFLLLELISLVKKYPDITQDQLICLMSLRGDIGKLDVRQRAAEVFSDGHASQSAPMPRSIFSEIHVTASIFT